LLHQEATGAAADRQESVSSLPRLNLTAQVPLASELPQEAFERVLPRALGLHERDLVPLNVDLARAVAVAIGALPRILAFREQALADLPTMDVRYFDNLETYAFAAAHAHARFLNVSRPEEQVKTLNGAVASAYDALYTDALALSKRGLLPAIAVRKPKRRAVDEQSAFELSALIALFRQNWSNIVLKTAVTVEELSKAERLTEQLIAALAARADHARHLAKSADQRLRCFSLSCVVSPCLSKRTIRCGAR
jgi:hypothetical protein